MVLYVSFLLTQGFHSSKADPSLFISTTQHGMTLMLVYVDDIIITGADSAYIQDLILILSSRFVMKDLGKLSYFLGIEVFHHDQTLLLCQTKFGSGFIG